MKRRQYLTTVASLGTAGLLAGCSGTQSPAKTETQTDSAWPTEAEEPSPKSDSREWMGGHSDAEMRGGTVVLDGTSINVVAANVAQQVGVCTSNPDVENVETIPESEFKWYTAPDGSFFWFISVELTTNRGGEPDEIPPADQWRAHPVLSDADEPPTMSLTSAFDPDPMFYRLPLGEGDITQRAYSNNEVTRMNLRTLVFEVPSESIELLFGESPAVAWQFRKK